jgi:non-ribosomal peptide synthetase component E (peptide arylation enzyme)
MEAEIVGWRADREEAMRAYAKSLPLSLEALCDWLEAQGVAKIKWPERLVAVEVMPMTPTRKIIKSALANLARKKFVHGDRLVDQRD